MGEELKEVELDRRHRLGAPKEDKVRPIIVCEIRKIQYKKSSFQK